MLKNLSDEMADAVAKAAPAVVQVQGSRRPASGIVYAQDVVLTTSRALGRENGIRVRRGDGATFDAELAGRDPATALVVLAVKGLDAPAAARAADAPRVGHLALALARSWSNSLTASAGIVSVIGGPLRTSRRGAIEEVIRTTAPMHEGFAGGALIDTDGGVLGVATASAIRGLGVVIPAAIAWKTADHVLAHGRTKRGYLGVAGQRVTLPAAQRADSAQDSGVLVISVGADTPAAEAGILVGDILLALDGQAVASPDDLLDLLSGDRVGRPVTVRISRGGTGVDLSVSVRERDARS